MASIANNLQKEIDTLLSSVDDKSLLAETIEQEVYELENIRGHENLCRIHDERILMKRPKIYSANSILRRKKAKTFFRLLFAKLEY